MKRYQHPQLTVEIFDEQDIITTSLTDGGAGGEGGSLDFGDLQ